MKKILLAFLMLLSAFNLFAQNNETQMATLMRSNGKIYVVVVCVAIILIGLLAYLFAIDKRLKMLEKKSSDKN
jgi:EamA domain-containing membrane protein RarD